VPRQWYRPSNVRRPADSAASPWLRRSQHDQVKRARPHERVYDLQRHRTIVGLGDEDLFDDAADTTRVLRDERVVHIDEGDDATACLGRGQSLEQEPCDADSLGTEDLADPASGPPAYAEDTFELGNTRGKDIDVRVGQAAEPLERANAELLLDAGNNCGQVLIARPLGWTGRRHRSAKA